MSVLGRILERVGERLEERVRRRPGADVRREAEASPRPSSFLGALDRPGTSLIAEAKHASPSKGVLRDPYEPVALAREYEAAGARAMSILTEPDFFRGAAEHLVAVRGATKLPVLRKDFLIDPYQCWEARAWGASAALLIVAALGDARLRDLHDLLTELGLAPLVEVHDEQELDRALGIGAAFVGINNRDLATFDTTLDTTVRLARRTPEDVFVVSESGILNREHVQRVEAAGARAVLVGEALLVADSPGAKVRELIGENEA